MLSRGNFRLFWG